MMLINMTGNDLHIAGDDFNDDVEKEVNANLIYMSILVYNVTHGGFAANTWC